MAEMVKAKAEDAESLAKLYAKAFEKTGFKKLAAPEKRDELIAWLCPLCEEGKLWFIADEIEPVVLCHYDAEKDEIITIATRDGMEGRGYGERMLKGLLGMFPTLKVRPVTRGGKALATKCGFEPSEEDESLWVRKTS